VEMTEKGHYGFTVKVKVRVPGNSPVRSLAHSL
jgi:hypothetical protein